MRAALKVLMLVYVLNSIHIFLMSYQYLGVVFMGHCCFCLKVNLCVMNYFFKIMVFMTLCSLFSFIIMVISVLSKFLVSA